MTRPFEEITSDLQETGTHRNLPADAKELHPCNDSKLTKIPDKRMLQLKLVKPLQYDNHNKSIMFH